MIDISSDILDSREFEKVIEEMYGSRAVKSGIVRDLIAIDEYFAFWKIDDVEFDLSEDFCWDIICLSTRDSRGNKYIKEIAEYINGVVK